MTITSYSELENLVGKVFYNNKFEQGCSQLDDLKDGFYKFIRVKPSIFSSNYRNSNPTKELYFKNAMVFVKCNKNGKLFKKDYSYSIDGIVNRFKSGQFTFMESFGDVVVDVK